MTAIEWTDKTWNPVIGCARVSPGCDNCYAIGTAHRLSAMQAAQGFERQSYVPPLTVNRDGEGLDWTGEVRYLPHKLDEPLRWREPQRVFVNSMSDLFHPDVPVEFIVDVWNTMALAPQHTFQILTKRPKRARDFLRQFEADGWSRRRSDMGWVGLDGPLANVWLGTSIESDRYAFRADALRETPAAVRFLSLEPLLGPLPSLDLTGIDWVIVGGESGPGARPMHPQWVRNIRDRCVDAGADGVGPVCETCDGTGVTDACDPDDLEADQSPLEAWGYMCDDCEGHGRRSVPFFFKQWGNWRPVRDGRMADLAVVEHLEYGEAYPWWRILPARMVRERDKHFDGYDRLDGRTWKDSPDER